MIEREHDPALPADAEGDGLSKTPIYRAMHAERHNRQDQIRAIQNTTGRKLICYTATKAPISRDDTLGFAELLHNIKQHSDIDLMLHTGGGDIDAAEKLTYMLRQTVGTGRLRVIIPDYAKSAGTLMALAADAIVMSDCSELGPIDPQIAIRDRDGNAVLQPAFSYLEAFDVHSKALRKNPDDVVARVMLAKLDPATLVLLSAARNRAQRLADHHLNQWMFHQRRVDYTKISEALMDVNKWLVHGRMIGYQAAQDLELIVEYIASSESAWRRLWQLYCHQRMSLKDGQKLFESECVSFPV